MNIKKISKIIALVFVIGGFVLILGKRAWFPDFYNPIYNGIMAFVSTFLIILPRLIFKPKDSEQEKILDLVQAGALIVLSLSALGGLGLFQLYKFGFQYDKLVHFVASAIFTIAAMKLCQQWYKMSFKKSIILSIIIIFLAGIAWELYEFLADVLFGTQMFGVYGQYIIKDTTWDIIMNCLGIVAAVAGLSIFKNRNTEIK
ncbi:MAG: DUF2238 domain-containing protein [bacterium]|nr:DUF2238 domain-containing protein [bacterium]